MKMVNTHRIPGNKVFVPAGVVENEGKHAVHKNLGGKVAQVSSWSRWQQKIQNHHLFEKVRPVLLVEVEENLAVTVRSESHLEGHV